MGQGKYHRATCLTGARGREPCARGLTGAARQRPEPMDRPNAFHRSTAYEVKVGKLARFGRALGKGTGMVLYTHAKDPAGRSKCFGTCASIWPPYLVPHAAP